MESYERDDVQTHYAEVEHGPVQLYPIYVRLFRKIYGSDLNHSIDDVFNKILDEIQSIKKRRVSKLGI